MSDNTITHNHGVRSECNSSCPASLFQRVKTLQAQVTELEGEKKALVISVEEWKEDGGEKYSQGYTDGENASQAKVKELEDRLTIMESDQKKKFDLIMQKGQENQLLTTEAEKCREALESVKRLTINDDVKIFTAIWNVAQQALNTKEGK